MSTQLSDLEDRLRREMRQATAGERMPPGLARRAQRNRRRRIMTRATTAAGTAAAVAAVTVAAAGTAGAPRNAGIRTTAYVVEHTESALVTAAADIMVTRATDGRQEYWLYQEKGPDSQSRIETFSGTGQPVTDIAIVVALPAEVETSVSYPTKTWWRGQAAEAPAPLIGPLCGPPVDSDQPAAVLSADIRQELACGRLTDEGTQYVDRVGAIKLVSVRIVPGVKPPETVTMTVWVDPISYLPVRLRYAQNQAGKVLSDSDSDYRWLPPTSANLAQLRVPIPAGFRQVPRPQG
jgi:hypothetical protein